MRNLRAALTYSEQDDGLRALGFAASLQRFWEIRGYIREGLTRFTALLTRPDAQNPTRERAEALNGAGVLAFMESHSVRATAYHQESLRIRREIGDALGITYSLANLANVAARQGDYPQGITLLEEVLTLVRELGHREREASALNNLGLLHLEQGGSERAQALFEASLALSRSLGNSQMIALTLTNIGIAYVQQADPEERGIEAVVQQKALACYQEALEIQRSLGEQTGIARTLSNIGNLARAARDYVAARAAAVDCLTLYHRLNNRHGVAYAMALLGIIALEQKQWKRAAILCGVENTLRQAIGAPYTQRQQTQRDHFMETVRLAHGEEALQEDLAAGEALSLEESLTYACSENSDQT